MNNLKIQYKRKGRTYSYKGQDLTKSAWYIVDEDGNTYADQNVLEEAMKAKEQKVVAKKKAAPKKVTVKED